MAVLPPWHTEVVLDSEVHAADERDLSVSDIEHLGEGRRKGAAATMASSRLRRGRGRGMQGMSVLVPCRVRPVHVNSASWSAGRPVLASREEERDAEGVDVAVVASAVVTGERAPQQEHRCRATYDLGPLAVRDLSIHEGPR